MLKALKDVARRLQSVEKRVASGYERARKSRDEELAATFCDGPEWLLPQVACHAMNQGDEETTVRIVRAGLLADACDPEGKPLLHVAAKAGFARVVQELVERGARVDEWFEGDSPLALAVASGSSATVSAILDAYDWNDDVLEELLDKSVAQGETATVRVLLEQGADPNRGSEEDGETALHLAIRSEARTSLIEALLQHGADPSPRASCQECPLELAVAEGHPDAVDLLIEAGAERAGRDRDSLLALARATQEALALDKVDTQCAVPALLGALGIRASGEEDAQGRASGVVIREDTLSVEECDGALGASATKLAEEFGTLGYRRIGTFSIPAMRLRFDAWVAQRELAYACVYEQKGEVWCDVVSMYQRATTHTTTTVPGAGLAQDLRDFPKVRLLPEATASEIHEEHLRGRRCGAFPVAAERFVDDITAAYRAEVLARRYD